jgi:hypothetical protein
MRRILNGATIAMLTTALLALTSCAGNGNMNPGMSGASNGNGPSIGGPTLSVDTDTSTDEPDEDTGNSVLRHLGTTTTIGSTVDPLNGDQNPYGLDIAKASAGAIALGDLVVCNFNDAANVQGTGTTVIALHPQPGSAPTRIAQDASLLGCDALALAPNDNIWAAAFGANDNPIFTPGGALVTTLPGGPWHHPFGQAFAPNPGPFGIAAFYESNAADGSIVRIDIHPGPTFTFDVIATGFAVNGGAPGGILGPSGLQYDAKHDRLYIVDGANNTLVSFRHVSTIPQGGIVVNGTSFGGPFARRARLVFSGAPLNGPISSALLPDGHIVLGNTLDPSGQNLMVEIAPHAGRVLDVKNVDTGAAGALFGMVATGRNRDDARLYFNDDNDNTVKVLTR